MRKTLCLLLALAVILPACSNDDPIEPPAPDADYSQVLSVYSQTVVVPTYEDLATKAAALNVAAAALAADPTSQAKLDAAAAAWVTTREPWESSEAFLFGPAAFLSLDPSLDSWPVDRQQLNSVLASGLSLTPTFIAQGLGPALRGFHTIEYLLFRDGAPRVVGNVTTRELEYLVSVTQVLADDAALLFEEWDTGFASEFANAGHSGSRYQTQGDALLEIIEGIIAIADEVANGKIADPFDQQNVELVESQFSWNSLTDFRHNIGSTWNAYTGGYHLGTDGSGLDQVVRSRDAQLDDRIQAEIQDAMAAIAAIPEPFRNNLDQTALIVAAQQACNKIAATFEQDVKPLFFE
jgi:predicted lipoprotein